MTSDLLSVKPLPEPMQTFLDSFALIVLALIIYFIVGLC